MYYSKRLFKAENWYISFALHLLQFCPILGQDEKVYAFRSYFLMEFLLCMASLFPGIGA